MNMGDRAETDLPSEYVGRKYGRLLVVREFRRDGVPYPLFECLCDCGRTINPPTYLVKYGKRTSCRCKNDAATGDRFRKHGMGATRFYARWNGMIHRCTNESNSAYSRYGGRGIKVCERWLKFENFKEDLYDSYLAMVAAVGDGRPLQIDRIDNDGNYEPANCRWASAMTQANNRRSNVKIDYMGRTQTQAEWAREFGVTQSYLRDKFKEGKSLEDIHLLCIQSGKCR